VADPSKLEHLALDLLKRGDLPGAHRTLLELAQLRPNDQALRGRITQVEAIIAQRQESQQRIQAEPLRYALAYLKAGRLAEGLQLLRDALARDPTNVKLRELALEVARKLQAQVATRAGPIPTPAPQMALPGADPMRARREAEERTKREAEDRARREAEERARQEAEERARRDAAERARREASERIRREAEERVRRDAEERARREAEAARLKREAEERARREAEERARREAEERARREAEERVRRDAEQRARRDAEAARLKRAAEERARREAEEQARREAGGARERISARSGDAPAAFQPSKAGAPEAELRARARLDAPGRDAGTLRRSARDARVAILEGLLKKIEARRRRI
jgi:hypothetical protein